jgi:hypothetical protein
VTQSHEPPELAALIYALHERVATDEQIIQARELLQSSAEARQLYFEYISLIVALQWSMRKPAAVAIRQSQAAPRHRAIRKKRATPVLEFLGRVAASALKPVIWSGVGVGALFLAYFVAISWDMRGRRAGNDDAIAHAPAVATFRESADVSWTNKPGTSGPEADSTRHGRVAIGEPLCLGSGLVELRLRQGATVVVEGPAQWKIDGENQVTLTQGKLVAKVSTAATGFTVETPSAKVVDLGTEFAVEVAQSGATDVHVIRGTVDLYRDVDGAVAARSPATREVWTARLHAGEAMRTRIDAPSSIPIDYDSQKFAQSLTPSRRPRSLPTRLVDLSRAEVSQSSMWPEDIADFSPHSAVDGKPETISHTTGEAIEQWWQVDLGGTQPIAAIILKNRAIRCGWLRDIRISIVADDARTVLFTSELLNRDNQQYGGPREFEAGPPQIVLDLRNANGEIVRGRVVRVERIASGADLSDIQTDRRAETLAAAAHALVLAEVEVYTEVSQLDKGERSGKLPSEN